MPARLIGLLLATALALSSTAASAQRRLALVVGVNRYDHIPLLRNAENDADSMAAALRQLGFEVVPRRNLTYAALNEELRSFANKIGEGDTALFFFAGHGYNDGAQDLLMPSDIQRFSKDQVKGIQNQSLSAERVINVFQSRGARFAIVIVDTCRRNPFELSSGYGGPLRVIIRTPLPIPPGVQTESFEIYSAGPQQQALDRLSEDDPVRNSVFTRVLLKHMLATPRPLEQVARNVRAEVQQLVSRGDPRRSQTPTYVNNITEDFFLTPSVLRTAPAQPPLPIRVRPTAAEAAQRCDRLAAAPDDEQRPRELAGVHREFIDALPAVEACEAAVQASRNDVRLRFQLGRAYRANLENDKARAAFEEAARAGYAAAETALVADMLDIEAVEGPQNYSERAFAYLRRAMSRNARAETYLGLMTIRGQVPPYHLAGSDPAYAAGVRFLRRAYERRDPEAAFWLGIMFYLGRSVQPNYRLAEAYFRTAAEAGHRRAILHLGSLYRDWRDAPDHMASARGYWEAAARLGSGQATENLAKYYELGWGGAPDRQKACELYEKAGELGYETSWTRYLALCPAFARQRRTELTPPPGGGSAMLVPVREEIAR